MKVHKLLSFIILNLAILSCDDTKKTVEAYFSFDVSVLKAQYQPQDIVELTILNGKNKKIDSIVYYVNDENIGTKKDNRVSFDLKGKKLGYQNLKALVYFDGSTAAEEVVGRIEVVSDINPKLLTYTIVNTYKHDTKSFTEGLEFYRDTLIESTGQMGSSYFRKMDAKTGYVYKQVNLDAKYFGEGITVINDKIFQLTWQNNVGLIYNANTLKQEKTFTYDKKVEGWGMTNDGENIYHSDGTEKIWKMNPETQKMISYINVYTNDSKIKSVNELEWIDGKIYGNIWQKDAIAIINPETGAVEAVLDLSALRKKVTNADAEVLNGIAYNKKTKTIFITGKNWDKTFEIKVN